MGNESHEQSWTARYGTSDGQIDPRLERFLTHRSVRHFSKEPVAESVVASLVGCAQSAATSSNLQSWSVISVQEPDLRARLAAAAGDQKQILTCAWFFVFLADLHRLPHLIGAADHAMDTAEMFTVAAIDAALASERMVCAAESLGLGTCYIGAIRNQPDVIRTELRLPPLTFALFGLCLGHPLAGRPGAVKPRLSQDQVWFRERYPARIEPGNYDDRMAAFWNSQGLNSEKNWSETCKARIQTPGLSGREKLLQHLQEQGLLLR